MDPSSPWCSRRRVARCDRAPAPASSGLSRKALSRPSRPTCPSRPRWHQRCWKWPSDCPCLLVGFERQVALEAAGHAFIGQRLRGADLREEIPGECVVLENTKERFIVRQGHVLFGASLERGDLLVAAELAESREGLQARAERLLRGRRGAGRNGQVDEIVRVGRRS